MKIYLDLVFILNIYYDFLILISTSILLKRNVPIKNIVISSLLGNINLIFLFISVDKIILLVIRLLLSCLMIYITFNKKNFLENLFYFYIITIILGGSSYLLDSTLINIILMIFISPIILFLYTIFNKEYKLKINFLYDVIIINNDKTYKLSGYLDTGNKLIDPITKYPVIMVREDLLVDIKKIFYVPYNVVNSSSLLKCCMVDKVLINNREVKVLLGLCKNNIFNDTDVIINDNLKEIII